MTFPCFSTIYMYVPYLYLFESYCRHCKARQAAVVRDKKGKQQKDKRLIMNMEDLSKALQEYGVNVKHQEYFTDNPSAGLESASKDELNAVTSASEVTLVELDGDRDYHMPVKLGGSGGIVCLKYISVSLCYALCFTRQLFNLSSY
ncbi:putative transcription initiation factor TFIID, 23-30kDa subunit [Helianthus debilis subsp. tardiflorus]